MPAITKVESLAVAASSRSGANASRRPRCPAAIVAMHTPYASGDAGRYVPRTRTGVQLAPPSIRTRALLTAARLPGRLVSVPATASTKERVPC